MDIVLDVVGIFDGQDVETLTRDTPGIFMLYSLKTYVQKY